jgi:hypothetical protein
MDMRSYDHMWVQLGELIGVWDGMLDLVVAGKSIVGKEERQDRTFAKDECALAADLLDRRRSRQPHFARG